MIVRLLHARECMSKAVLDKNSSLLPSEPSGSLCLLFSLDSPGAHAWEFSAVLEGGTCLFETPRCQHLVASSRRRSAKSIDPCRSIRPMALSPWIYGPDCPYLSTSLCLCRFIYPPVCLPTYPSGPMCLSICACCFRLLFLQEDFARRRNRLVQASTAEMSKREEDFFSLVRGGF